MTVLGDLAVTTFTNHYNCSQAVLSVFAGEFGVDERTALRLASPFGGGLARRGEACGAVTGGLMALGLARGTDTPYSKDEIYRLSHEFMSRFEARHGTLLCRGLIGCDISTPEGHEQAAAKGVFKDICPGLVCEAVEILQELLLTP